jgi:CPA2 family monovalent cation:H+ antiporter-2
LMPAEGLSLILAGALLSITLNPLVFSLTDRVCAWIRARPKVKETCEDFGERNFALLQAELDAAKEKALQKAAAHKTFTPEELVAKFPLFAGLTPEQREVLILHFRPHTAQPGERIIRKGDKADAVYFISSGEVEVSVAKRRIKLGAGDFFGEMALISGQPRSADVTALDYGKFLTLSQGDFREFVRKFPGIREQITALASQREEMNRHATDDENLQPA